MPTPAPTRTGWAAPRGPFPQPPAPLRPDGLAVVYRRRDPTVTPLYPLVQHHLETFLADAATADPRLAGDLLRVLLRGIRATLRRASPSAPGDARLGAVSFLHRFGSALNPHFHFHVVVLDGVFSGGDDGSVTFHEATHLDADDVLRLERTLQRRVLRLFQRRGLLTEATVENMLTWQASGGFSLDASVRIHGSHAAGRERVINLGRDAAEATGELASSAADSLPARTGTSTADADLPDSPQRAAARSRWARLLARIYEVFPLTCPDCGADMRILAFGSSGTGRLTPHRFRLLPRIVDADPRQLHLSGGRQKCV